MLRLLSISAIAAGTMAAFCAMPVPVMAKGCIKGAVVGGVAGHYAGHHGVAGAVAGCAVGHHMANKPAKDAAAPPAGAQPAVQSE